MRNFIRFIALTIVISICMCGCSLLPIDDTPAVVEMTTKSGQTILAASRNGLGLNRSGSRQAFANACTIILQDEEDVLNVHFYCEACGHDEECEFNTPASRMFQCDCPTEGDDNDNAKEYFALVVTMKSAEESTEETE